MGGAPALQNGWASILQAKPPPHFARQVVMLLEPAPWEAGGV